MSVSTEVDYSGIKSHVDAPAYGGGVIRSFYRTATRITDNGGPSDPSTYLVEVEVGARQVLPDGSYFGGYGEAW